MSVKYHFSGIPDLHRLIAENAGALGCIVSSAGGVVGLFRATYDEMTAVFNGGCRIGHSTCAVVKEAQTPRVSYAINRSDQWSGLQYQDRGDKSPVLERGIYLPDGWRLVTGAAPEIRRAFVALSVRRRTPSKTTVEVIDVA
jgi:hypothetical protein